MKNAAQAYGNAVIQNASPRELEATVLLDAASRLQAARDASGGRSDKLNHALKYNEKLWTILVTAATSNDNPLSVEIRQNIANLGLFVFKQTMMVMANPEPERLGSLIDINRQLASGLRSKA